MSSNLKTFCKDCDKLTAHRKKLAALNNNNVVCNICDTENSICKLFKSIGDLESVFEKSSREVRFVEFDENGKGAELHKTPKVGRHLLMSPFNNNFTWLTTSITEIISNKKNHLVFKTKNSTYELYYTHI